MPKERQRDRVNRKLLKMAAEYRLLASSGKSEIIPSPQDQAAPSSSDAGEERQRFMQLKRKRDACIMPKLYYKSSADEEAAVELNDVFALCLYSALGNKVNRPRRFELTRWRQVSQAIFVIVDQDGAPISDSEFNQFPYIQGNFLRRYSVSWSQKENPDFYQGLFFIPMTVGDHLRGTVNNGYFKNWIRSGATRTNEATKLDLILSPIEMAEEDFPMPIYFAVASESDFAHSRKTYKRPTNSSPVYAIDCEMCMTGINRREVTRISVVDEQCRVVLDTLVKPEFPVTDYLTRFSGITASMLENVTTNLADVHRLLEQLLEPDAILCGHTLHIDLQYLRIFHPFVIDVSLAFNLNGTRKRRSALRVLASTFLDGMDIQQSDDGHCSVEDAYATMRLLNRKLFEGDRGNGDSAFGNVVDGWDFHAFTEKERSIRKRLIEHDWNPARKRPKLDSPPVHVNCACENHIQFHCHQDCSCRRMARLSCVECIKNRSHPEEKCKNDMETADLMKQLFPPWETSSSANAHTQSRNISAMLRREKKRLLWIHVGNQAEFDACGGKKGNVFQQIAVSASDEDVNKAVLHNFRKRMYEYDLNVLELRHAGKEQQLDATVQSIVQASAAKSLLCVLFCDRKETSEERTGRCYIKIKE